MIEEGPLNGKLKHMESAIAAGDAAETRKTYLEIRQLYEKMPDKKKSKYYDQILKLYKNSL